MQFYVLHDANEECDIHPSPGKIVRQIPAKRNGQGAQISATNVNTCHTAAHLHLEEQEHTHIESIFFCINSLMITTKG